jgi:uncharacterized protein YukE
MAGLARKPLPKPARSAVARGPSPGGGGAGPGPGRAPKLSGPAARDPRFLKVVDRLQQSARVVKAHPPPGRKAAEAQAAAVSPPQERAAGAQAAQVAVMQQAEAKPPDKGGFLAMLRQQIQALMPKDLDGADKFMKGGEKDQLKGAVSGGVKDQKDEASGPTQQAAAQAPDQAAVAPREATPMPGEPAPAPPAVPGAEAMPAPRPAAEVAALSDQPKQDADRQLADAQVTPQQLDEANDPRFSKVNATRAAVQKQAEAAPGQFRVAEGATLKSAGAQAQAESAKGLVGMTGVRGGAALAVKSRQQLAKERDEARRKEVADHIQGIYLRTKQRVEARLDALEPEVLGLFDRGADAALEAMKTYANTEIDAFKDERYSGLRGKARWLADLFGDVPDEIKAILKRARERFMKQMDGLAVDVAALVDRRIAEAKAEIARGEAEIKVYVAGLPRDLQGVGQAAAQQIAAKFDELRSAVDARQEGLAQKLAEKYKAASDKSNEELKKLEDANKGLLRGLVDALAAVVRAILEFKDRMVAVFKKGADTVMLIIRAPIRFLGFLLDAVKKGFGQFVDNIWNHLKAGFMSWLFGSLAETGVEMPKDFSLGSVLKLVLQVLGITYDKMRAKAVKLLGERAVSILEKVFGFISTLITSGPAKMWEEMKEYLSDLKAQVIDALQDWVVTTVIKAAVTKLVTMFNPVGAIVQAILTIYNFVMFIVEQAQKILALIEAIVNSVAEIAAGNISKAANWIEQALARLVPVAIGLLARLLGLSGITDKIKEIIKKVQAMVDKAIDKVIEKIVGVVKKLFGRGKGEPEKDDGKAAAIELPVDMDGESHTLSIGAGGSTTLLLASKKEPASAKLGRAIAKIRKANAGDKRLEPLETIQGKVREAEQAEQKKLSKQELEKLLDKIGSLLRSYAKKFKTKDVENVLGYPAPDVGLHGDLTSAEQGRRAKEPLPDGKIRESHHAPPVQLADTIASQLSAAGRGQGTDGPLKQSAARFRKAATTGHGDKLPAIMIHENTHRTSGGEGPRVHGSEIRDDLEKEIAGLYRKYAADEYARTKSKDELSVKPGEEAFKRQLLVVAKAEEGSGFTRLGPALRSSAPAIVARFYKRARDQSISAVAVAIRASEVDGPSEKKEAAVTKLKGLAKTEWEDNLVKLVE